MQRRSAITKTSANERVQFWYSDLDLHYPLFLRISSAHLFKTPAEEEKEKEENKKKMTENEEKIDGSEEKYFSSETKVVVKRKTSTMTTIRTSNHGCNILVRIKIYSMLLEIILRGKKSVNRNGFSFFFPSRREKMRSNFSKVNGTPSSNLPSQERESEKYGERWDESERWDFNGPSVFVHCLSISETCCPSPGTSISFDQIIRKDVRRARTLLGVCESEMLSLSLKKRWYRSQWYGFGLGLDFFAASIFSTQYVPKCGRSKYRVINKTQADYITHASECRCFLRIIHICSHSHNSYRDANTHIQKAWPPYAKCRFFVSACRVRHKAERCAAQISNYKQVWNSSLLLRGRLA